MASIRFVQRGRGNRAVVLVHAFPLSSLMYDKVASILSSRHPQIPIILVDLPGCNGSTQNPGWTMTSEMSDLHQWLITEGIESVIMGGTSMGGYAVFAYYKQFPDEVAGLILSNTKADADDDKAKVVREEFAQAVEAGGAIVAVNKQLESLLGKSTQKNHPEIVNEVRDWILSTKPEAIAEALRAMAKREDSKSLLPEIICPTLVISSTEDTLMKEESLVSIADHVTDSDYIKLTGIGHLSPVENPEEWANAVSAFLGDNDLI